MRVKALTLLATLALGACGGINRITPGLTVTCDGHCQIAPANLRHQPEPGARPEIPPT